MITKRAFLKGMLIAPVVALFGRFLPKKAEAAVSPFYRARRYTGLKDVTGKMVFEGDTVIDTAYGSRYTEEQPCIVEWGGKWDSCGFVLTGTKPWANDFVEFTNDILNLRWDRKLKIL